MGSSSPCRVYFAVKSLPPPRLSFKQLIQAFCLRDSDSLTVKCWQMSASSPSMLYLTLGEANSLSSCFCLFPARQWKDSRGDLGWSQLRCSWGGAAPVRSWAGVLTHIEALSISKHYTTSGDTGVWWEISPFGFTRLARTIGSLGPWIRATAGDGVRCARMPARPQGGPGDVGVGRAPSSPAEPRTMGAPERCQIGERGCLRAMKLCRAVPFKTYCVNLRGISERPPATMCPFQVLTIHFRKGRGIPGAMGGTSEQNPSGIFQNGRSAYGHLGQKVPVPLLRPPGHRGL